MVIAGLLVVNCTTVVNQLKNIYNLIVKCIFFYFYIVLIQNFNHITFLGIFVKL